MTVKRSAATARISGGVDRVCSECDKEFYLGIQMDSWMYKIRKGGNVIKYQCGYSCWKKASDKITDMRGKVRKKETT